MGNRGRKSAAHLAVVPLIKGPVPEQIAPPADLTEPEALAVFRTVVESRPAGAFGEEHADPIAAYARHVVNGRRIAAEIKKLDPEKDLALWSKLLDLQERQTRAASSLATRLRIAPNSQHDNRQARRLAAIDRRPWE